MAEKRTPKTPEIIEEMIALYNSDKEAKRPRKNQFTLKEIVEFAKSKGDKKWIEAEYNKRALFTSDGVKLPLGKKQTDEVRTLFLDKYFAKKPKDPKQPKLTKKEQEAKEIEELFKK